MLLPRGVTRGGRHLPVIGHGVHVPSAATMICMAFPLVQEAERRWVGTAPSDRAPNHLVDEHHVRVSTANRPLRELLADALLALRAIAH
jgi:hypothetical protein